MSFTERIVAEAQTRLDEINAEIEKTVGPLVEEKKELEGHIKKLTKGSGTNGSAESVVSDEALIEAVVKASTKAGGPVSSKDLATALGVDTRNIARKLTKLSSNGDIKGDKTAGYAAV